MWLVRSKDQPEGPAPTLLYGYGGFASDIADNRSLRSRFIPFIEAGGTVALPALRGGAELSDHWHVAGARHNKRWNRDRR